MAGDAASAPAKPAGDFDYESLDSDYSAVRRTDPRIAELVHGGLGSARRVVNVGAGAGSYEPFDLRVTPVEPSAFMRSLRSPDVSRAINAVGENLPFFDASFDAAMAMVTVHQWSDHERGLRELRRVSRGPPDVEQRVVEQLRSDLESGEWDRRFGSARALPVFHGSLRLIVATP